MFSRPYVDDPSGCRSSSTRRSRRSGGVEVEALPAEAIHRLLWSRLGLNLPRPELMRVHEIAGGNPFFALELGRAIARGAIRVDSANVALPESLSALVAERLQCASGACPRHARCRRRPRGPLGHPARAVGGGRCRRHRGGREAGRASSSTATGSTSPIRCSPPPATRRCRCTGGVGSTAASPSWRSISKSAPAISPSPPPGRTSKSRQPWTRRQRTPTRGARLWLRRSWRSVPSR